MSIVGNGFNLISWSTSAIAKILWNINNLKVKLSFSALYFALSIYIFARFDSSCPYVWLLEIWLFNRAWGRLFANTLLTEVVGLMMSGMNRKIEKSIVAGIMSEDNAIRVFFSLKLTQYNLNVPFVDRYSWISASVYCVGFSSYKALNRDLAMVSFDFSIHTTRFLRNLQSFYTLLLCINLKSAFIYPLKSSWNDFYRSSSL